MGVLAHDVWTRRKERVLSFVVLSERLMAELTQVHNPANAAGKPRIVFIHGLDGDARDTWMSNPKVDSTLWPKWLGEDTGCPVWLLGYGAAMSRWKKDAMALPKQATAVLECLSTEPTLMAGPLVLVGHSLGGVIIKTVLKQGLGRDVERHKRLVQNIKGIAFIGTPHFGSYLASLAARFHLVRANPQVADLALDDANLEELNQLFLKQQKDLGIKARVYSETQPMRLPGFWRWLPLGATVVSPSSSQPHISGEAGTPIEADHRSICKPTRRSAGLYPSMKAFVEEVGAAAPPHTPGTASDPRPVSSNRFQALPAEEKADTVVHVAFATHGYSKTGCTEALVCGALCLVTDDPERLRMTLEQVRTAVTADPLVPLAVKGKLAKATLREIVQMPSARVAALRQLSMTSFSAYLYYCSKAEFDGMTEDERTQLMLVKPLFHRLSKKNQFIRMVHSQVANILDLIESARKEVKATYKRNPALPIAGSSKLAPLEELASFVVFAMCDHLSNSQSASAAEVFESLRTRIRYAENVTTGEKHKRDINPLP